MLTNPERIARSGQSSHCVQQIISRRATRRRKKPGIASHPQTGRAPRTALQRNKHEPNDAFATFIKPTLF
jgi:hypothetical protein